MERVIVNNGIYCYLWLDFWDSTVPIMHSFPELSPLEYSAGNVFNPCAHSVLQIGLETDAWASRAGGFGGQHCSIHRLGCWVVGPVLLLGLCEPGLHREEKRSGRGAGLLVLALWTAYPCLRLTAPVSDRETE
jgi:hypothetical protein